MVKDLPLGFNESVTYKLRSLYNSYGYSRYRMSKFEEYDLYARNKDFLISDSVITFTDTNGKLMALKPDVTLSIVKNIREEGRGVQKLYYNENVYRVAKGSRCFKEIMQVGLECFGEIDDYCISEVLMLAAESLRCVSEECILDVSDLDIVSGLIDKVGIPASASKAVLKCIGEKNIHELNRICAENSVSAEDSAVLSKLLTTSGKIAEVLPEVSAMLEGYGLYDSVARLSRVCAALEGSAVYDMLRLDFSAVDDINYYNGIVFKGYVQGLPGSVLSGGQYDRLMSKMQRKSGAIGFALYMDVLERLDMNRREFDVDVLLVYDGAQELSAISKFAAKLSKDGKSVMVQRSVPEKLRYRQLIKLCGSEVKLIENNA